MKLGMWARALAGNGAESIAERELVCTDLSKDRGKAHITKCLGTA